LPLSKSPGVCEKAARNGAQHNIPLRQRKSFLLIARCANAFFYRSARIAGESRQQPARDRRLPRCQKRASMAAE
jgi:hypothetical protein